MKSFGPRGVANEGLTYEFGMFFLIVTHYLLEVEYLGEVEYPPEVQVLISRGND